MTFLDYTPHTHLIKNDFGFYEPDTTIQPTVPLMDMMLLPLLAFDNRGHRLGFGKGHYDRYFSSMRRDNITVPLKVGLAFEYQQGEAIPSESHDEKLDAVLLPHTYIIFNDRTF